MKRLLLFALLASTAYGAPLLSIQEVYDPSKPSGIIQGTTNNIPITLNNFGIQDAAEARVLGQELARRGLNQEQAKRIAVSNAEGKYSSRFFQKCYVDQCRMAYWSVIKKHHG